MDFNNEKVSEMSQSQFSSLRRRVSRTSFSDFAIFCQEVKGWSFVDINKRRQIYKYELFNLGYDAQKLLEGQYKEIVKFKRELENDNWKEQRVQKIIQGYNSKYGI